MRVTRTPYDGLSTRKGGVPCAFVRAIRPVALLMVIVFCRSTLAQMPFEQAPISYRTASPDDAVSRLQKKLDAGDVTLSYDQHFGYLRSVLEQLDISLSTQTLVFSKTSFQLRRISPHAPRALYFSDDAYVGWVNAGDVVEVSVVDANLGANFYTLNLRETSEPRFVRQTDTCLQCHGSSLSRGVPGHMVRSVFVDHDGQLILSAGSHLTDQTSPFRQRWGGWYVTGDHGSQRHLGNLMMEPSADPDALNLDDGANVKDLTGRFPTSAYLTPHSDIVALMVLEHQTAMQNRITQANFQTRLALRDQNVMNEMLDRPDSYRSESTRRRISKAADAVVQYMLFVRETELTDGVAGTSKFSQEFALRGPFDSRRRSLRQFDLKSRLFKYPCSYLIYSEAFDRLPHDAKDIIYRRLWDVLTGQDASGEFTHLSTQDRIAIREILLDTKAGLPEYWKGAN